MAQFWLFKTEPDEFSIDDLAHKKREDWDGIRNYQARNTLRDKVKLGDWVFIYHSSCKKIGIAGLAKVEREAFTDSSQFDGESKYFDAKSAIDKPKWVSVEISFMEKFRRFLPTAEMKVDLTLMEMQLFKQSRLSISEVTAEQAKQICQLCQSSLLSD